MSMETASPKQLRRRRAGKLRHYGVHVSGRVMQWRMRNTIRPNIGVHPVWNWRVVLARSATEAAYRVANERLLQEKGA